MSERLKTVLLCVGVSAAVSTGVWLLFDAFEAEPLSDRVITDAPALGLGQVITAKFVSADQFVLSDVHGNARAILGMGPDGNRPSLCFGDAEGNVRMTLCLTDKDVPIVALFGEDGTERLRLVVEGDRPYQNFTDPEHRSRISFGVTDEGPVLGLLGTDTDETDDSVILMLGDAGASLSFLEDGVQRMVLGHTTTHDIDTKRATSWPVSTLHLFGKDGLVKWRAP